LLTAPATTLAQRAWRWHVLGAAAGAVVLLGLSHDPRLAFAALVAPVLSRVHLVLLERHGLAAPLDRGVQAAGTGLRLGLLTLGGLAAMWLLRSEAPGLLLGICLYPLAFLLAAMRTPQVSG
jgi:hypothetical protein